MYHLSDNDEANYMCPNDDSSAYYAYTNGRYTLLDEDDNAVTDYTVASGGNITAAVSNGDIYFSGEANAQGYIDIDIPGYDCIPRWYFYIDN